MSWIFKEGPSSPPDPKAARQRALLLSLPFMLMGLFALVLLLHDGLLGGLSRQKTMGLLSAIIVCIGFPLLIFGITAKKNALRAAELKPPDGGKPWLKREDWAAGRVVSSSDSALVFFWIFAIFWCGISTAITVAVVPQEWRRGNHEALIALIFPVVGLALLTYAFKTTLAWRRYRQSIFEMAAVPGALGGTLEGMIQLNTRLRPEHGLHLRLSCVHRTTTGAGKNRHTSEKILWQDEKWLRPDLPEPEGHTGIPVYFKLPADQPEATAGKGDGIHWQLEASARVPGPSFRATFEVPVFKLPETPAPSDDPTTSYQMSLDEIRQQIHSPIRVNGTPDGGREFIFPAARNPGFATGATVFWLIWTGAVIFLIYHRAPFIFPLVFGTVDLLMTLFVLDLWLRRSRVVVTPSEITVKTSWLGLGSQRRLAAAQVAGIDLHQGASAGHQAYYDLKIRSADGRHFTAAAYIPDKPEADWLVREMATALGRPPGVIKTSRQPSPTG
jgi:hypothetical protein